MKTLIDAALLVGVLTMYAGEFVGQPLYCDDGVGMVYADRLAFIALPVSEFESGRAECGDRIRIYFSNGETIEAVALDAGPFKDLCVMYGAECIKIIADIPMHLWSYHDEISHRGKIVNLNMVKRAFEQFVEQ